MSKTENTNKIPLPYSYHTFLFPFLWNISGSAQYSDFEKFLAVGKRWVEEKWDDAVNSTASKADLSDDVWRLRYAAYQYFTPAAKDILFNIGQKNNVRLFRFVQNSDSQKMQYVIEKGGITYTLDLTSIRLKVYHTGVAIVMISGENHNHRSLDDVNAINEYGRRTNLPFLSDPSHSICADRLSLLVDGQIVSVDDFQAFLKELNSDKDMQSISWNYIMKPIQYLIDGDGVDNGGLRVTTNRNTADNEFLIKPCIDDRMFVYCLVRDEAFSRRLKQYDRTQNAYHYLTGCSGHQADEHKKLSDLLYKFVEIEVDLSCPSVVMEQKRLEDLIYDRWIADGTIHGISPHSVVCITGEGDGLLGCVINPFQTQIVEMASLTVVQKAYQLLLFDRISAISNKFNEDTQLDDEQFKEIERLQALYVLCQNQILLSQVTTQEQGIDLYARLQKQLLITEGKQAIDEQVNNLRDVSTISHERLIRANEEKIAQRDARSQKAFNFLAIIFSVFSILDPLENSFLEKSWYNAIYWFVIKVIVLIVFCLFLFRKRRDPNDK